MSILKFLGLGTDVKEPSAETETVRRIVQELERLDRQEARYIACFAYLLGRVAHADLAISEEETRAMERVVVERGGLPEEEAIIVVQMAKAQNRLFGGTENFLVTREFDRIATREQKLALLHCLFAVGSSDATVSVIEENEIRQIASELKLEHKDYIAVRLQYRNHLSVLKKRTQNL